MSCGVRTITSCSIIQRTSTRTPPRWPATTTADSEDYIVRLTRRNGPSALHGTDRPDRLL